MKDELRDEPQEGNPYVGQTSLEGIDMKRIWDEGYSACKAAGYHKLPTPGTKEYEELMEKFVELVLELVSDLKYANARGAASRNLFHKFLRVLSSNKEKKE